MSAAAVASSSSEAIEEPAYPLLISYRGKNHDIFWPVKSTLAELQDQIADLTDVDATHQKLLGSGPLRNSLTKAKENGHRSLSELGLSSNPTGSDRIVKIMIIGPTREELDEVHKGDVEAEKRNRPRQYHPSLLKGTKARNTATTSLDNPFHSLQVNPISKPHSTEYNDVLNRLKKLSTDSAVLHVCRIHGFQVGVLTELLPHEHPNLLGLNENMGQRISLRLRTMKMDGGLIHYKDVRKVLLHELAHNKINDHPTEFKILNSELNAQVEAYEMQVKRGTHQLSDMDVYVPPEERDGAHDSIQETAHVLGGIGSNPIDDGDLQSKRQRVLMATMKRLEKTEADIERGCGSTT